MGIEPHVLHKLLLNSVNKNKLNFLEQGEFLYQLRKNSSYREAIGDGIDNWHDYLAQPEIGMSPTQANKLLNIYDLFILNLKYSEEEIIKISIKTLNYILKRKSEFEKFSKELQCEILEQAKVLSFKDFKEAYFDQRSEESGEERTYEYVLMKKCHQTGNITKVHNVPPEKLKIFGGFYDSD